MTSIGPTPVSSATPEEPCPVCGVYFGSNLAMRIHCAKMHGETSLARKPDNADSRRSVEVQHHSLDGMPTCRHCKLRLTTWNNSRSHILNSCNVLHRRPTTLAGDSAANAQASEQTLEAASLPKEGSESPGPAWPSAAGPQSSFVGPIFSRLEVRELLGTSRWKRVLKLEGVSKELQHHCVICHQWTASGGIKRHVSAMHPAAWTLSSTSDARCSTVAEVAAKPCLACGAAVAPRTKHKCTVMWQLVLMDLLYAQEISSTPSSSHVPIPGPASASGTGKLLSAPDPGRCPDGRDTSCHAGDSEPGQAVCNFTCRKQVAPRYLACSGQVQGHRRSRNMPTGGVNLRL